ncbi:hypothetical protein Plhal304r1_c040g0117611 [Plasmopara halstedii]
MVADSKNFTCVSMKLHVVESNGLSSSTDGHAFESTRHYNEACNLLFAQYLRNKDLPEEGVVSCCIMRPEY